MIVEDTGDVEISGDSSSDTLLYYQEDKVSLNWNPTALRKLVSNLIGADDEIAVDIKVFEINETTYHLSTCI